MPLDFGKSRHIRHLRDRRHEMLQVLLTSFELTKTTNGSGTRLAIRISGDDYTIVSADGKRVFARKAASTQQDKMALTLYLQEFYTDPLRCHQKFDVTNSPLRYANGGVLPVVIWHGQPCFCLFYRDIFPIGWNIANGASDTVQEMLAPRRIIDREFAEEILLVDLDGGILYTHEPPDGHAVPGHQTVIDAWSRRLSARLQRDVELARFRRLPIPLHWIDGPDSVEVSIDGRRHQSDGYFLSITPQDNAIELDRPAFVTVGPEITFLDGESRRGKLLNRVVGLFRVERVRPFFLGDRPEGAKPAPAFSPPQHYEMIPDYIFHDGQSWPVPAGASEPTRKAVLSDRIQSYLGADTLIRTRGELEAYAREADKFRFCPITESLVGRYFKVRSADPTRS